MTKFTAHVDKRVVSERQVVVNIQHLGTSRVFTLSSWLVETGEAGLSYRKISDFLAIKFTARMLHCYE